MMKKTTVFGVTYDPILLFFSKKTITWHFFTGNSKSSPLSVEQGFTIPA
ncbi:MAG TPA: hypothetical protein VK469_15905 [Candidatus Kapabacteria bacterium]|nr:hypothetical protein [Candidatus Kapabacteria bacterium]